MRDRTWIAIGLGAFLVVGAYPVWHAAVAPSPGGPPSLERAREGPCVEDTLYMLAHHQDLLNVWRTAVVRDGQREYVSASRRRYDMNLTTTCLRCHANSQTFCERCHQYAGVEVTCWSCHVTPEGS